MIDHVERCRFTRRLGSAARDTIATLYHRADQALYRAKRCGRDQVRLTEAG